MEMVAQAEMDHIKIALESLLHEFGLWIQFL